MTAGRAFAAEDAAGAAEGSATAERDGDADAGFVIADGAFAATQATAPDDDSTTTRAFTRDIGGLYQRLSAPRTNKWPFCSAGFGLAAGVGQQRRVSRGVSGRQA